jgi:hypothetical protein
MAYSNYLVMKKEDFKKELVDLAILDLIYGLLKLFSDEKRRF